LWESLAKSFWLVYILIKQKMLGSNGWITSPLFQLQITPADLHDDNLRKGIAVEPYALCSIFLSISGCHII